jgi:hypothetical protein
VTGYRANPIQGNYIVTTQTNQAETQNDRHTSSRPNPELLAAIDEHRAAAAGHIAYVVPMSELWEDDGHSDENCIVVPLSGATADEYDYGDGHLYAEVRGLHAGTALHCVMMAHGRIALSGPAVHLARAERRGRLLILWIFDDERAFSEYRFSDDLAEDLWVASRVAESHSIPTPGSTTRLRLAEARRVIDVSEYIVVGIQEVC